MTIDQLELILTKANYDYKDIMALEECKSTKANLIMNLIRVRFDGTVPGRTNCVKSESYWRYAGTTIDEQLRRMRILRGESK